MRTQVTPQYAAIVCNLFAQLGVRGSSVLLASGDNGYDFYASPCTNMLTHTSQKSRCRRLPDKQWYGKFPAEFPGFL
jgi:hypothetical protein